MEQHIPYYKLYLREELARRCETNPNYSMRSFARALSLDPAVLSRALSDKRALSYKVARRVAESLSLSPKESSIFLESVAEDHKQRGLKRSTPESQESALPKQEINQLDADIFRIIGDWYHYAILQITYLDEFQSNPRWIAKRLGITVLETKLAILRLKSVGLLEEVDGKYRATSARIDTKDKNVSSPALRRHQKQMLQKAIFSLENDPINKRSMTGLTFPIDPNKIPLAKELIQRFTQQICDVLSSGAKKNLYQLTISLFPLEKPAEMDHTEYFTEDLLK